MEYDKAVINSPEESWIANELAHLLLENPARWHFLRPFMPEIGVAYA